METLTVSAHLGARAWRWYLNLRPWKRVALFVVWTYAIFCLGSLGAQLTASDMADPGYLDGVAWVIDDYEDGNGAPAGTVEDYCHGQLDSRTSLALTRPTSDYEDGWIGGCQDTLSNTRDH